MPTFAEAFALAAGRELGHCVGDAAQPVRVFDIVTEEMMLVNAINNAQIAGLRASIDGSGRLVISGVSSIGGEQRQIAAWLLGLSPLRQAEAIAAMQSKAHELGMP